MEHQFGVFNKSYINHDPEVKSGQAQRGHLLCNGKKKLFCENLALELLACSNT
jgi:hypothetical protein